MARDAFGWDMVTRTFCVTDAAALREIADRLDATTAICGGIAALAKGTMEVSFAMLGAIFEASPLIIGGLGTLLVFWFLKALVLWLLLHWVIWFVALPCCLVFVVCEGVATKRVARLHDALLDAALDSLRATLRPGE